MLKKIPHINFILPIFFLIVSWEINAQNILIKKDGVGLCPGGSIGLFTTDPTLVSYKWEIYRNAAQGWSAVNSTSATSATLTHNEAAKYRLLAVDNTNAQRISNEIDVSQLTAPPVPLITPSRAVTQICQGDSIILNTVTQNGYFYYWIVDGVQLSIPQTAKIVAKKAATYELLIVDNSINSNACSAKSVPYRLDYKSTEVAKVNPVPIFCTTNYAPINLVATPAGGRYKGVGITEENLGTFDPAKAGAGRHTITYTYTPTGGGSCPDLVDNTTIVIAAPLPKFTTSTGKLQFCNGDTPTLTGAANFKNPVWLLNGNQIANTVNLPITVGGEYEFKATDTDGCLLSSKNKIEFFAPSSVSMEPIKSVCGTEFPTVPLKGTPLGGAFTIDGQFATVFDYKKLGIGKHKVTYQTDGSLPCLKGAADQEVLIQEAPNFDLGEDVLLGKGSNITLKSPVDATSTYLWSPATGLDDPTSPNPVASPVATSKYFLTIKTSLGCTGKDSINIIVYQPVYIPTAFSPNEDNMNDHWELAGMEAYPNAEVQIFNRWGNVVYYLKGAYNLAPFDGTEKNKLLPEGMYVYKISPFPDRPDFQYKGTFMLLR